MRIRADELPFQSHPVAINIGVDGWRRVTEARNVPKGSRQMLGDATTVYVEGIIYPLRIPSALMMEVSHV